MSVKNLLSTHPNIAIENVATLRTNLTYYMYTKQDNYYGNLIIFQIYRASYMAFYFIVNFLAGQTCNRISSLIDSKIGLSFDVALRRIVRSKESAMSNDEGYMVAMSIHLSNCRRVERVTFQDLLGVTIKTGYRAIVWHGLIGQCSHRSVNNRLLQNDVAKNHLNSMERVCKQHVSCFTWKPA